jgi:hypothetical protein
MVSSARSRRAWLPPGCSRTLAATARQSAVRAGNAGVAGSIATHTTSSRPWWTRTALSTCQMQSSMPDTAWPVGGHPPGLSRNSWYIPVSMSPVYVSTRHQRFACARLPDPYLTHQVRLFPHRSPQQSLANAAVGGLKPSPAGRLRRAYLHPPRGTASRNSAYIKLLSAFVTHTSTYAVRGAVPRRRRPLCVRAHRAWATDGGGKPTTQLRSPDLTPVRAGGPRLTRTRFPERRHGHEPYDHVGRPRPVLR